MTEAKNEVKPQKKLELAFVIYGKGQTNTMSIDKTCFAPPAELLVGSNVQLFHSSYRLYLNSLLHNTEEKIKTENLFAIASVFDIIEKSGKPVRITSSKHRNKLPEIVKIMNTFILVNQALIRTLVKQLNG